MTPRRSRGLREAEEERWHNQKRPQKGAACESKTELRLAGCGYMKFIPCNTGAKGTVSLGVVWSVASTVVVLPMLMGVQEGAHADVVK